MDVAANEDRHGTKKGKNILESRSVQTNTCTVCLHAKQGINNVWSNNKKTSNNLHMYKEGEFTTTS